ncbi:pumilio homology domain family member [Anaeramoeba flamelloides]|uniref:Pumilio homology domain family member n=1 Tax=Anaeramoeba flamelloides TaxID=1746091 RepID=A0AAV8A3C3_9EUKA|nr:pumilio homology domain family member [Anaeramoeba flamelloides]
MNVDHNQQQQNTKQTSGKPNTSLTKGFFAYDTKFAEFFVPPKPQNKTSQETLNKSKSIQLQRKPKHIKNLSWEIPPFSNFKNSSSFKELQNSNSAKTQYNQNSINYNNQTNSYFNNVVKSPKSSYLWGYEKNSNLQRTINSNNNNNNSNNNSNNYNNNNSNYKNNNSTNQQNNYHFNQDLLHFTTNKQQIQKPRNISPILSPKNLGITNTSAKKELLYEKNQLNKIPIPISNLQQNNQMGNFNSNNLLNNQKNLNVNQNQMNHNHINQNKNQGQNQNQKQSQNQNQNNKFNANNLSQRTRNKIHLSKLRRKPRERRSWSIALKTQIEKKEFLTQIDVKKNYQQYYSNFPINGEQFLKPKILHQSKMKPKIQDQTNKFQPTNIYNNQMQQKSNEKVIENKKEYETNQNNVKVDVNVNENKIENEKEMKTTINEANNSKKTPQPSPRTIELRSFGHRRSVSYDSGKVPMNPNYERFTSIEDVIGRIYLVAKDQFGCRFLQKQIENTKDTKITKIILDEIYNHLIEIIIDPFGNYLIQKMFEYATTEDKSLIFKQISPELPSISLNQYGTRAVQKMIELINHRDHSSILIHGIKSAFVELSNDSNGNHILQKCLYKLTEEDKKYIYQGMIDHCVVISTHKHGCCVMQRSIDSAKDQDLELIIQTIIDNAFILIQDRYANYVIQYIVNKGFRWNGIAEIVKQNLYSFSIQKFSSNVVEKCLNVFNYRYKQLLIYELINMPKNRILKLLKDRYANYVIQTALDVANDKDNEKLSDVIFPHLPSLKKTRYGKKIQQKIYRNTTLTEKLTLSQKRNMGHGKSKSWQRSTTLKKW